MDALYRARLLRYFSGCSWYSSLTDGQAKLFSAATWIQFDAIPDLLNLRLLWVIDIRTDHVSYTFRIIRVDREYQITLECESKELTHISLK